MVDTRSAQIIDFPDLPPKGSRGYGGKRALLGPEIGTSFDIGQRLFAYYLRRRRCVRLWLTTCEYTARDYKVMLSRNGMAAALEQVLTLPIRGAPYTIEPAKGDKGEAEFVESVMMTPDESGGMSTPISTLVGQITAGQVFKRSFFEKVWKVRESDGRIIYDKVAYRPPATCQARYNDRTGEANGFRQQVWLFGGNLMLARKQKVPGYVDIPKIRSYIYTHGKHREPLTGISELETSLWCYNTMAKLMYLWYAYLEGYAMQRLVVYGNDQPEATQRADDIAQLKGSGVVGLIHPIDGQKTFEALPTAQDAGAQFAAAMTFLEGWMASSVLAGFLQLTNAAARGSRAGGGAASGSYGMSEDQSSYYLASREAVATEISDSISHDLIRPLVMLNFGADAAFPQWKFGPLQEAMTAVLFTMFGQMAAAPKLNVPLAFIDLLTERMAVILDLDSDQVHDALVNTASQRAEALAGNPPPGMPPEAAAGLGQLQGIAQAGTAIAQQAGAQGAPSPPRRPASPVKPPSLPAAPSLGPGGGPPAPPAGKPPMAPGAPQ
jgi:hypothetical protein